MVLDAIRGRYPSGSIQGLSSTAVVGTFHDANYRERASVANGPGGLKATLTYWHWSVLADSWVLVVGW